MFSVAGAHIAKVRMETVEKGDMQKRPDYKELMVDLMKDLNIMLRAV